MIIIKLQGGLGNQMFQYAAGMALGLKYNVPVYLDHSFLERNNQNSNGFTARKYELNIFDITAHRFSSKVMDQYFDSTKAETIYAYTELPVSYDVNFKKLKPSIYISGNWQSPKYFDAISNQLRLDFRFNQYELIKKTAPVVDKLITSNSVAIHVRRGDYVTLIDSAQTYSICDQGYYKRAVEAIMKQVSDAIFFVFSEDINWAKQNLKFDSCKIHFIQKKQNADWLDMYLMSMCNHNIIANSTFSWWAAWLNANKSKIIIAPQNWFHLVPPGFNLKHLYLKEWIRM